MRSLIVATALVSALAFASGAFAQTTQQPTQPSRPAPSCYPPLFNGPTGGNLEYKLNPLFCNPLRLASKRS
jgi:hypothetical protein